MLGLSARLSNSCLGHQPSRGEECIFGKAFFLSIKVVIRGNNRNAAAPLTFFYDLVPVLFLNYICGDGAINFSALTAKHPAVVNGSASGVRLAASY